MAQAMCNESNLLNPISFNFFALSITYKFFRTLGGVRLPVGKGRLAHWPLYVNEE